jgi:hypothetical protein
MGRAAVDHDLGAFAGAAIDRVADAVTRGAGDHGPHLGGLVVAVAHPKRLGGLAQGPHQLVVYVPHGHDHRARHAALAGGPKGRADNSGHGLVDHGVRHHNHVVLRPAQGLHALARLCRALVDDPRHGGGADE